jgi:hypothetical protein
MATKLTLASPANFAANSLVTEFPAVSGLGWAAFFGDGSLNNQDNANLAGTGAFTNVGSGPVLSQNFATFTYGTNALQTPTPDASTFTMLWVCRFKNAFSVSGGVGDGTNNSGVQFSSSGQMTFGVAGLVGATLAGLYTGQWICMCMQKGPVGAYGALTNLSAGTTAPSTAVMNSVINTVNANWQIGGAQTVLTGYGNPVDIAFSMGARSVMSAQQQAQAYTSLKAIMAARNIVVL